MQLLTMLAQMIHNTFKHVHETKVCSLVLTGGAGLGSDWYIPVRTNIPYVDMPVRTNRTKKWSKILRKYLKNKKLNYSILIIT